MSKVIDQLEQEGGICRECEIVRGYRPVTDYVKLCPRHAAIVPNWQLIETAPPYKTLLTIHEDDLYPVCAFYVEQDGERHWVRVIEGPEDVIRTEDGDHGSLYRPPTHWILPPDPPTEEAKNGQA